MTIPKDEVVDFWRDKSAGSEKKYIKPELVPIGVLQMYH